MRWSQYGPWLAAAAFLISFVILIGGIAYTLYGQNENEKRITENSKTAQALCDAAAGARDFWIKVRTSTRHLLSDPDLSDIARRSNEQFEEALTEVILAAGGVARSCDDD